MAPGEPPPSKPGRVPPLTSEPPCGVEGLILHRGRMKLVRTLERAGEGWAETEAVVEASWPLFEKTGMDPVALVELVAQSVGVYMGWSRRHTDPGGARGLLVGVKRAVLAPGRLAAGARLHTRVVQLRKFESYAVFRGTVHEGERLWGEAEIQTLRTDDWQGAGDTPSPTDAGRAADGGGR